LLGISTSFDFNTMTVLSQDFHLFLSNLNDRLLHFDKEWRLEQFSILNKFNQITHQPRIYFLCALGCFTSLITIQILGLSFISNLFAFIPIYSSFKAMRSGSTNDDEFWLTYWVVYGSFGLIESFLDVMLFWMPFYYILKITLLFFAFNPNTRGAEFIYKKILGPLFGTLENESRVIIEEIEEEEQEEYSKLRR
jgi:receptor expression-enhancing protein 5/6